MRNHNDSDVGVEITGDAPAGDPMDGVTTDFLLVAMPGADGQPIERHQVGTLAELVERVQPTVSTSIRTATGAPLDATAADLREIDVELRIGAESPGNPEQDFLERGVVWKTRRANAPADTEPIAMRPLLAGRTEQDALQLLLQVHHQQQEQHGTSDLQCAEVRRRVAVELRRRADELDDLVRRHQPSTRAPKE